MLFYYNVKLIKNIIINKNLKFSLQHLLLNKFRLMKGLFMILVGVQIGKIYLFFGFLINKK